MPKIENALLESEHSRGSLTSEKKQNELVLGLNLGMIEMFLTFVISLDYETALSVTGYETAL